MKRSVSQSASATSATTGTMMTARSRQEIFDRRKVTLGQKNTRTVIMSLYVPSRTRCPPGI